MAVTDFEMIPEGIFYNQQWLLCCFLLIEDDADGAPAAFEYILLLGYRVPSMFF
jgi:hypothetical protein